MTEITTNQNARLHELNRMLQSERKKSPKRRDYARLDAICCEIFELTATDAQRAQLARGKSKLIANAQKYRRTEIGKMRRFVLSAAACIAVLCGFHGLSVHAFGGGFMQAVYERVVGGAQFQPVDSGLIRTENMREICASCGFSPLLPSYIPAQFAMAHTETDKNPYVNFCFENGSQRIALSIEGFPSEQTARDIMTGFPSEKFRIGEMRLNGREILTSWEDAQFTAVFMQDQVLYTVFTEELAYSEALKIVESFFD